MLIPGSTFIVLYTTDIARTLKFYQFLEVKIVESDKEKVVVGLAGFELHFILNSTEPFQTYRYIANPDNYGHGVIFYLGTSNIHEASDLITKAGGKVIADIFENHWGCYELLFEDPNGYKFALYQEKK